VGEGDGAGARWIGLMARKKSLRSQLYRAARDVGNLEAARRAPRATAGGEAEGVPFDQHGHGAVSAQAGAVGQNRSDAALAR